MTHHNESNVRNELQIARPFFSIIMPCFNSEKFVKESVESVLSQSFRDFELIVVDDGSTDKTKAIVEGYCAIDDRVKLKCTTSSGGAAAARNAGGQVARGAWLCFLDSDDLFEKFCLEQRRKYISENNIKFFSSNFYRLYDNNIKIRQSDENRHWAEVLGCSDADELRILYQADELFLEGVLAWTGGVTVKREVFNELGGFDQRLQRAEDHHLWLRCAALVKSIGLILRPDVSYRIRDNGLSGGINRVTSYSIKMFELLEKDPLFKMHRSAIRKNKLRFLYMVSVARRNDRRWIGSVAFSFRFWLAKPFSKVAIRNLVGSILMRN